MNHIPDLWPLVAYIAAVLLLIASLMGLSYILGQRHHGTRTGEAYESGLVPTGTAWIHFDVKYYLFAVFFVILDMESIFIFAWAVTVKEAGWAGYVVIATFIGILLAALFYLWRTEALSIRQ